ncbi:MAG: NAD-binding protein [Pirellulales bacterium]
MPAKTPLTRVRRGFVVLGVVMLSAIGGYKLLTGKSWLEAAYMVVITVSSVGFSESTVVGPAMQIYFILLILLGMSAAGYTLGGFFQMMTEGEIDRALGLRRASREIKQLKDHTILCGFGRTGHVLAEQLARKKQQFVVIDKSSDAIADAQELGYSIVVGDATEEETLLAAGVERAKNVVTVLSDDADSVFIALSARNINAGLHIIARAEQKSSQKKLIQASADRVVLPAAIGAQRIAAMLLRPTTVELFELVMDRAELDVEVAEITIGPDSPLAGLTARIANARQKHGLMIVAVRQAAGKMLFNPDGDLPFTTGDTLIVIGNPSDIARFREQLPGEG